VLVNWWCKGQKRTYRRTIPDMLRRSFIYLLFLFLPEAWRHVASLTLFCVVLRNRLRNTHRNKFRIRLAQAGLIGESGVENSVIKSTHNLPSHSIQKPSTIVFSGVSSLLNTPLVPAGHSTASWLSPRIFSREKSGTLIGFDTGFSAGSVIILYHRRAMDESGEC